MAKQVRYHLRSILKFSYRKVILILLLALLPLGYIFAFKDLPSPTSLSSESISKSSHIFDRNGDLLFTIYTSKNQTFIPLSEIPKTLQQATIAIEDKDFYKHGAIDIRGILRAFISTVFYNRVQGGSTITQQLVKNTLLTSERTLNRKIKEVILAFATEILYPKDKILEMYLNQVPYGGTAYGVEAASSTYFGKNVNELTLAESAFLAGLPEAPSIYSPFGSHPEKAKERQKIVLQKMYEQNYITREQKDFANSQELQFKTLSNPIKAPHFVLYVKELLEEKYGEKLVDQGGLTIRTSLDLDLQEFAQETVASEVAKLTQYHVSNGATLITNPVSGEILAMVGSKGYFDTTTDGNVNITLSHLQPGSSIKPINYAVGFLKGYTAATPFIDQPVCFPSPPGPDYCPKNYDGKFHGVAQMRFALGNSYNIPAVKMLKTNGVDAMIATASAMGIKTFKDPSRYGLSLTLGGGEVRMLDMAVAYGVFANQGYRRDLHPILEVVDSFGKILEKYTPAQSPIFGKRVLPSEVSYIISHILLDNNARQDAFGGNSLLKIGNYPVSVKTGTTNDYRDNWTIGYTPSYVAVVWVGNNDHTPMSGIVSGVTGAAPIWNKIMAHLLLDTPPEWPQKPNGIIGKTVCSTSGLLPPPEGTPDRCPSRFEYFIKGTEPKITDPGRQKVFIDKTTNDLPKKDQTENLEERSEIVITDPTGERYCLTCPHPEPLQKPAP